MSFFKKIFKPARVEIQDAYTDGNDSNLCPDKKTVLTTLNYLYTGEILIYKVKSILNTQVGEYSIVEGYKVIDLVCIPHSSGGYVICQKR